MPLLRSNTPYRKDEFQTRNVREEYNQIQRDPYKYLLTPVERANALAPIPRMLIGYTLGALWMMYHLKRNNQLHRLFQFRITGDLVIGAYSRFLLAYVVGDRLAAWTFIDYKAIWCHKAADYEVRKIMRTVPDCKPHINLYNLPNSYLWV